MKWKYESKYYIIDNALKTLKNNPLETKITLLRCKFIAKTLFQVLFIASNVGIMNYSRVFVLYKFFNKHTYISNLLTTTFSATSFFHCFVFFFYTFIKIFSLQAGKNNKILFLNTSLYFFLRSYGKVK